MSVRQRLCTVVDLRSLRWDPKPTSFIFLHQVNPSTYAIMQARLHFLRPDLGTREPCCVSTKLTGIRTIEYYRDNVYSVRSYEEMVVEECGCR